MATATCHTPGCGNDGIPIAGLIHPINEDTGEPWEPWSVYCGVCGQQITDITDDDTVPESQT